MKRMLNQKLIDFLISLGDSLKYESSTNTFEIGTNLEVDGKARLPIILIDPLKDKTGVQLYFDSDNFQLVFDFLNDGLSYTLDPSGASGSILTSEKIKTFFGNKSILIDPRYPENNNIDLYRHQLTLINRVDDEYLMIVYSSNNLNVDSVQDLVSLIKANNKYATNVIKISDGSSSLLKYNGSIWVLTDGSNVISVSDIVTTI